MLRSADFDLVRAGHGNEQERLTLMQAHRVEVAARIVELQEILQLTDHKIHVYEGRIAAGDADQLCPESLDQRPVRDQGNAPPELTGTSLLILTGGIAPAPPRVLRKPYFAADADDRLYGAQASYAAVKAMKEQLGGSLISCQKSEVFDRLVRQGMGVVLQAALAACPTAVV